MIIEEGAIKIIAPHVNQRGPGKIEGVFYNRDMVFNRDTSIFLLHNIPIRNALDALAATGVRGIRIAKELKIDVSINDRNPKAYELIKKNVQLNKVNAEILNRDANSIMAERRFDYVDVDPFGTPVPYIDMALRSGKIIGISATDTATLSGTTSKIERRYLAKILKNPGNHELGIRILLAYIARMAARFDRGIVPLLSYWRGHAYRVYIRIRRGPGMANKSLSKVKNTEFGGPLWTGSIHDLEFLRSAEIPESIDEKEFEKYLTLWKNEKFFMYYEIPEICSTLHISQPPILKIISGLREVGYEAYRTHFSPQGIKTNAPSDYLQRVLSTLLR